ncbi:hypothetical protein KUCAC02_029712 [Chaenocephalus aceratus]|nr:hypothetical protein KUCAC02_029712 [Chaenocephalus aceratus]
MDCPGQITVSQVMTCPGFKPQHKCVQCYNCSRVMIPIAMSLLCSQIAENSKAKRRELSAALKAVVAADPSTVEVVMDYHTCFTPAK